MYCVLFFRFSADFLAGHAGKSSQRKPEKALRHALGWQDVNMLRILNLFQQEQNLTNCEAECLISPEWFHGCLIVILSTIGFSLAIVTDCLSTVHELPYHISSYVAASFL